MNNGNILPMSLGFILSMLDIAPCLMWLVLAEQLVMMCDFPNGLSKESRPQNAFLDLFEPIEVQFFLPAFLIPTEKLKKFILNNIVHYLTVPRNTTLVSLSNFNKM